MHNQDRRGDDSSKRQPVKRTVYGLEDGVWAAEVCTTCTIEAVRSAHIPELVVPSDEEDSRGESDFEGKQQGDNFYLVLPTIYKVTIEYIGDGVDVPAFIGREPKLAEE